MHISKICYQNELKISLKGSIRVPIYFSQANTGSKVALGYQFTIPKPRQGPRSKKNPSLKESKMAKNLSFVYVSIIFQKNVLECSLKLSSKHHLIILKTTKGQTQH